jgi:hypothetical protein
MNTDETVTDAQVVETPVVEKPALTALTAIETLNLQQAEFTKQLEAVKKDMATLQKQFEEKKILGVRLEGALQAGEILLKSLQK